MKKYIITALLITTMISMTACGGNKNTDTPAEETVVATEATVENPTANDEKVVLGTVNKEETATAETTAEAKSDAKTDAKATTSPDPKTTEAPKSTAAPETTAKPKSTETPKATTKPGTQTASVTATTKPVATEKPQSTTTPKATATPAATPAPKATAAPKATPAPTAAPVACQHTNYHIENGHDTENVPIAGGCYDVYNYSTKVCNDCGYSFGEAKNKVNTVHHGCVISEGVSATCTTDGRTTVWGCDCGGSGTTGGDVIPAFGHDYKEVFDHSEEIPNDDGISVTTKFYYVNVCRNCGDTSAPYEK